MADKNELQMENNEKAGRNIYYVSARKEDGKVIGWDVKREKCNRVSKICETKEEALNYVKTLAANSGATVIVRKMDGSIQDTIKYSAKK